MPVEATLIATPAGRFEVRQQGEPDAPLVLGLHGFPDIAATFDALGAEVAAAGFRFAAPQMRGHAPSTLDVPRGRVLFDRLADTGMVHVPYRGTGPVYAELRRGDVHALMDVPSTAAPHIQVNTVRALAVTGRLEEARHHRARATRSVAHAGLAETLPFGAAEGER